MYVRLCLHVCVACMGVVFVVCMCVSGTCCMCVCCVLCVCCVCEYHHVCTIIMLIIKYSYRQLKRWYELEEADNPMPLPTTLSAQHRRECERRHDTELLDCTFFS